MTRDARFWRNVTLVGLFHLLVLAAFIWWTQTPKRAPNDVVWMEGGAGSAASEANSAPSPPAAPVETPPDETTPEVVTPPPVKSEIELPPPTLSPTQTPTTTPTPTPTATPTPKPTPRPTPKPTPRATPKATPKPKPSPTPKKKATPKSARAEEAVAHKKKPAKTVSTTPKEKESDAGPAEKPAKKATAASGDGSAGAGGHGAGAGGAADFGWYGSMLHDRFYSEWVQPTSVVQSQKLSVLLKIRIQKDGRIPDYSIARSSGNPVVDDSVSAAAARVKQVDPLPSGLGGDYYDVNINFELGSGE